MAAMQLRAGALALLVNVLLCLTVSSCGGSTNTDYGVSVDTKATVENFKVRWDNKVEAMQEVASVLEAHLVANGDTPQGSALAPIDKAKFTQEKLKALVGSQLTGKVNEAALRADLELIASKFERKEKALKPDMSAALQANPKLTATSSGNLQMGGEVIDTTSLMGTANALVMNAKARGEDPEAALNYLRDEMLKKLKDNPPVIISLEGDGSANPNAASPNPRADPNIDIPQSLYVSCPWWKIWESNGYSCLRWRASIPYVFDGQFH